MEELVARLVDKTGIKRPVAEKAVGIILAFLMKEGPADKVRHLVDEMPGTQGLLDAANASEPQGFGAGMGGIMGAANRLMGAGLGMGEVQSVTQEFIAFAREKAGEDAVGEVVGAIPGLAVYV